MKSSPVMGNITSDDNKLINTENPHIVASYYIEDLKNEKYISTLIKYIEKQVRTSKMYTTYIGKVRSEVGLDRDVFLSNIDQDMASLELHHYPFTLFDLVRILIIKHLKEETPFSTFIIASEIMELHRLNLVGLVSLSITNHQLAHAGKLKIPFNKVFGQFQEFINSYIGYFPKDVKEKIINLIKEEDECERFLPILEVIKTNGQKF